MGWGLGFRRRGGIITPMVGLICGLGTILMTRTGFTVITKMGRLPMW